MQIETSRPIAVLFHTSLGVPTDWLFMAKKYVAYPVKRQDRAGNIIRGFVLGLAEFGCLGTRLYDLSGYPYESEVEALRSDWLAVGEDLWTAIDENDLEKLDEQEGRTSRSEDAGKPKR
jgi:hypothetical protein